MAGVYSCLANSSVSHPAIAPLPWRAKPRTEDFAQRNCFLPPTRTLRGPERYPFLRISTKLQKRLEHVRPLKLLSSLNKPKSSPSNNYAFRSTNIEAPEYSDNASIKEGKNWISLVKQIASTIGKSFTKPWIVPWGYATIFLFLFLERRFEFLVGTKIFPLFSRMDTLEDSLRGILCGLVSVITLYLCLFRFRPLPPDLFHFSFKGDWIIDVAIGYLLFPFTQDLCSFNFKLVGYIPPIADECLETAIMYRDYPAMALSFFKKTLWIPFCEEIVFRGFLLPSLTRYMPVPCSIVLSAVIFALQHRQPAYFLPVASFGLFAGATVARTRNMLPAVLLHAMWNMFISIELSQYWIGLYWQ